jgi:translocation and assembly module TamB
MKTLWRWLKRLTKYCFVAFLLLLLVIAGLLWYTTTESFQHMVRGRVIAGFESATGGRVELGSFHVIPLRFQVEVRDLTIHGREAADQIPYAHVESLLATVNLSSVLGGRIGFHSLTLSRPVIHIMFYPDGSSNLPIPQQKNGTVDFEHVFSVSIARLDVHQGELLYQDSRVPLDFSSNDISASTYYSFLRRRYSGDLKIGRAETVVGGFRPVAWSGKTSFAVDRNGIELKSVEANSGATRIQLVGTISDFRAPVLKGNYDLRVDLAQAGSVTRQQHLRGGTISMSGIGSWSAQTFFSDGKFDLHELSWQDNNLLARDASAAGKFSLDPQKLSVTDVQGEFVRGRFIAEAQVSNWQNQTKRTAKIEEVGTVKIKVKDFSVAEMLSSLGPKFRPVNKLRLAGNASGTADMHWRGSIDNADVGFALDIARPSRLQPGQIPFTASTHSTFDFRSGSLAISDLAANTPATQMHASGELSSASSLKLSFATTDLREWQPITAALFPAGIPFDIHGRAAFNGTASGKPANLILAGNLQVQDFDVSISRGGSVRPEQVHWDSLNADLQASARSVMLRNAVLRHGDAMVRLEGSSQLTAWTPDASSPFHMRVEMQNVDAEEVATLCGYDHTISGKVAGGFELSGTILQPHGQGNFNLMRGSLHGYPLDNATASLTINGDELAFKNALFAHGDSRVGANGAYNRRLRTMQVKLTGSNFDIADLPQLQHSRISVTGKLEFSAQVSGLIAAPDINADLRIRNLTLNGEEAGDYLLNASSHGPDLRLTGHSEFKSAELLLDGNIRLRERWPALIDLHFTHLDVDSFLQTYLHGHVTGHSAVAGNLRIQGPLLDPQQLTLAGNLTDFYADVENVKLRNDAPIQFNVTDRSLKLENFHILGDKTDFSGSGSMQFAGDRTLDFHGNGRIGLEVLHAYNPDFTSSGTLTAEAAVTGTLDAPLMKGKLQLKDAAVSDINLPSALSEINGTLLFNQNRITIESLSAKTGGGTVSLAGHADVMGRQLNFDLTANATDVRFRYPPGVSSTGTADLRWSGSTAGSVLSGDVTITKLGFTPGFDFGTYLERSAQISALPQTDPVLNKIRLDLHVVTAPELQMQTSVIRLQGEADLRVRGNLSKPVVLGRADVFEGEAYFNGTKYRLERGGVTFGTPSVANPSATIPLVDLQATTRVRDYEITLSMTGPAANPKLTYRSDPPLPPSDIIALLAFGQTSEESAQLQQSSSSAFSSQTSNALLAAALNATLNNRAQRLFGNTHIKIDPQGLATETSPTQSGPAVTIEQQVKDNLTLTYTTAVAQTSQQVIRAEYNVTRNVSVVAIRDQNGIVSFDVKIRRRKR